MSNLIQPKKLRNQRMSFRTTKDEKENIEWAAHVRDMSISDYIRMCALKEAGHQYANMTQGHFILIGEPCE